jgi:hypothetical protein
MLGAMFRFAWLALLALVACSSMKNEVASVRQGYAGKVQKVFRVVRQGGDLPGMSFFGKSGAALASKLRKNGETHQYVVSTPRGQIIAQSDEEFPVGECVQVIPQGDSAGPAFRYGEAEIVRSERCS